MQTEDTTQTENAVQATGQVIAFSVSDAAITEMAEKYKNPVVPVGKEAYEKLAADLQIVSKVRIAIDKERKLQNETALAHQRGVNKEGNRLIALVTAIESPLKLCKAEVDDAEAQRVRDAEAAESARLEGIRTRLEKIKGYTVIEFNIEIGEIDRRIEMFERLDPEVGFDEFAKAAGQLRGAGLIILRETRVEITKKAAAAALLVEQQKGIDAQNEVLEEGRRKLQEDTDAAASAKKAIDDEAAEVEAARLKKLEDEEATRKAAADEEEEAARKLAMAPDREKLLAFVTTIQMIELPVCESEVAEDIVTVIGTDLANIAQSLKTLAETL